MDRERIILIFSILGGVFCPTDAWARVWPVTLEIVNGVSSAPAFGAPSTHKRTINRVAAANNATALGRGAPVTPPIVLFPVVQGQIPKFVVQSPHTGMVNPLSPRDWLYAPANMLVSPNPPNGIVQPAFHCGRATSHTTWDIRQVAGNWVVDIFTDDNVNMNAAYWQGLQLVTFNWLIDDGSGSGSLQQGFAQQQRGAPIYWQGSPTTILRKRFNHNTGRTEVTKNGVITRRGYLNLLGGQLNRRQILRNYRYHR